MSVFFLFPLVQAFMQINEKQQQHLQNLILQEVHDGGNFQATDPKPIINIDYIFSGYNLFLANPMTWTDTSDPGFTGRQIFTPTYTKKQVTSDGRYKIPDHLNVISKKGCKYYFDSHSLQTTENIQNFFSSFVGLNLVSNFELTPWAFTASSEYYYMQQKMEQLQVIYAASSATCSVAQITTSPDLPEFNSDFLDALKLLPVEYSAPPYIEFLQNFGTHYLMEMTLGSRMGYVYTIPKDQMDLKNDKKFTEDTLAQAATITSALLKNVISQQVLPKNQDSSGFVDISKISLQTYVIEIGPQTQEGNTKIWLKESEAEPAPIKYQLKSLAELVQEGKKQIGDIKEFEKIGKNLKQAQTDLCKLLSLQNQRYGQCETNKREISQWVQSKSICLNFFQDCDWQGNSQQICGSRNPFQRIGMELPDVKANSIRFHSDFAVILGSIRFKRDKDLAIVLKAFHESYLILDKAEICLMNNGMLANTEYPVYITDSQKCVILLLWNACNGEIHYFTASICHTLDISEDMYDSINTDKKCQIALLDIRYPNNIGLRICLFKDDKMQGQSACFNNDQKEAFFGQEFKSMIIEESEVMVHRSIPGSIAVIFE